MKLAIRTLHLALAITIGPFVALAGASGAVLVFRSEIDALLNPSLWGVEPVSVRRSLDEVVGAVGDQTRLLVLPQRNDRAIVALIGQGDGRREVFVDPGTARILGQRRFGSSLVERVKRVHVGLYAGRAGRILVGVGGIGSLVLGATGLILWWRTRRATGRLIAVHRQLGLYSFAPSMIVALTGAFLVFRPYAAPVIERLTGPIPIDVVAHSRANPTATRPTVDEICRTALSRYPEAAVTRLYLPEGADGSYAVRLRLPEEGNPHGNTAILLDQYTGEILREVTSRGATLNQKVLWYAPYPWHTGDALGLAGRCIMAICGLALFGLLLTGVVSCLCRTTPFVVGQAGASTKSFGSRKGAGALAMGNPQLDTPGVADSGRASRISAENAE